MDDCPNTHNEFNTLARQFNTCLQQQDYLGCELLAEEAQAQLKPDLTPAQGALPTFLVGYVRRSRSELLKATIDPALDPDQRGAAARLLCGVPFFRRGAG